MYNTVAVHSGSGHLSEGGQEAGVRGDHALWNNMASHGSRTGITHLLSCLNLYVGYCMCICHIPTEFSLVPNKVCTCRTIILSASVINLQFLMSYVESCVN